MLTDASKPIYEVKANLFKGLAHPARIRVLELLSAADEVTVSDMLTDTGLEASNLSQHLAVLKRFRLVTAQRRGSLVYYRLAHPEVADLLQVARALLAAVLQQSRDQLAVADDLPALAGDAR